MSLPEPGTPLKLADGTEIDPTTGKVVGAEPFVKIPNNRELRHDYAMVQRRLVDLPLPATKMNGLSIVLTYKMIGLSDGEIAVATGLTEAQIGQLVISDAFGELRQMVLENIHAMDADMIRTAMKENATMGVQRIGQLINSEDEAIALSASKDALDRDGYRPADVVEHRHKMEGGLVIEVIRRDHTQAAPVIDADFSTVEEEDVTDDTTE